MLARTLNKFSPRNQALNGFSRHAACTAEKYVVINRHFSAESKDGEKKSTSSVPDLKAKRKALEDLPVTFSDISRANVAIRGGVRCGEQNYSRS